MSNRSCGLLRRLRAFLSRIQRELTIGRIYQISEFLPVFHIEVLIAPAPDSPCAFPQAVYHDKPQGMVGIV
jgi:hypothetical protein